MKRILLLSLSVISTTLLITQCTCKHICSNAVPMLRFTGFDSAELHAVIVEEYNNNGAFDRMWISHVYTNAIMPGPDTMQFLDGNIVLGYFSDYIIRIPSVGREWRITGLHADNYNTKGKEMCTNGLTYYLDGNINIIQADLSANSMPAYIFIRK